MEIALAIGLKEAFQFALIALLLLLYPVEDEKRGYLKSLFWGTLLGFSIGFVFGYIPSLSKRFSDNELWSVLRYTATIAVFYLGVAISALKHEPTIRAQRVAVFSVGFLALCFDSRAMGFLVYDMGAMQGNPYAVPALFAVGICLGLGPLVLLWKQIAKIDLQDVFSPSVLTMSIGVLMLATGGVKEFDKGDTLIAIERGFLGFVSSGVSALQTLLIIKPHEFISTPMSGLLGYLSGDRSAMSLMVILLMIPPVFALIEAFSKHDPVLEDSAVSAQKRLKIAFFRKGIFLRSIPIMTAFIILVYLIHAANISMNPLYEPVPMPVKESDDKTKLIIPLADSMGDIRDGKLRKYVYYYGSKQVVLIAAMKPDGTIGFCLDECEICRPAEWNKDAIGYAQKGDHLICKYCMTPIALPTLNSPGGCNPIPIPFKIKENEIIVETSEMIEIYKKLQNLDKKGTHL